MGQPAEDNDTPQSATTLNCALPTEDGLYSVTGKHATTGVEATDTFRYEVVTGKWFDTSSNEVGFADAVTINGETFVVTSWTKP